MTDGANVRNTKGDTQLAVASVPCCLCAPDCISYAVTTLLPLSLLNVQKLMHSFCFQHHGSVETLSIAVNSLYCLVMLAKKLPVSLISAQPATSCFVLCDFHSLLSFHPVTTLLLVLYIPALILPPHLYAYSNLTALSLQSGYSTTTSSSLPHLSAALTSISCSDIQLSVPQDPCKSIMHNQECHNHTTPASVALTECSSPTNKQLLATAEVQMDLFPCRECP